MTQKRKTEFSDNKKNRKRRKIHHIEQKIEINPPICEDFHFTTNISHLPDELLLLIFSYMNVAELNENVIPVCKKWSILAKTTSLWHTIKAGPNIPTETVLKWVETAGLKLKSLKLKRRTDAEVILKKVARVNKGLENIKIVSCWGTPRQTCLPSMVLCRLLQRCANITHISIVGCRFTSCKFFRLLATKNHFRVNKTHRQRSISYTGDASYPQLREFLNTRRLMNQKNGQERTTAGNIALYRINEGVYEQIINNVHDLRQEHINRVLEAVYGQPY